MKMSGLFLLLKVLGHFVAVTVATFSTGRSVRIQGVLACGGVSVVKARLKLYDGQGLKDAGTIANYEDEFLFQVKDIYPSKMYLTIEHHCDGGILHKTCWRNDKLTFKEIITARVIYHLGLLELQGTNVSHPKVAHNITSHGGCNCYRNNFFDPDSTSCRKFLESKGQKKI